uniref:Uncharacterized protein n=1 Tax=Cacopsylla melanoneura TaxID=428564 RepID=A0A8D9B6F3_9HEMI
MKLFKIRTHNLQSVIMINDLNHYATYKSIKVLELLHDFFLGLPLLLFPMFSPLPGMVLFFLVPIFLVLSFRTDLFLFLLFPSFRVVLSSRSFPLLEFIVFFIVPIFTSLILDIRKLIILAAIFFVLSFGTVLCFVLSFPSHSVVFSLKLLPPFRLVPLSFLLFPSVSFLIISSKSSGNVTLSQNL